MRNDSQDLPSKANPAGAENLASNREPYGVLTFGSFYLPQPSHPHQGAVANLAAFVADHSGGAVLDFHQLPSSRVVRPVGAVSREPSQHNRRQGAVSSPWRIAKNHTRLTTPAGLLNY